MKAEIRLANPQDTETFIQYVVSTPLNMFDPGIVQYPNLRTFAIDVKGEPVLYAPFHPVLMVESLAHKPNITPRENAVALRKLQDALEATAKAYGIGEIWWGCKDESLIEFATRLNKQTGTAEYEVVSFTMLRKKVMQ